jgi:putative transposase
VDIGYIAERVADLLDMPVQDIFNEGSYKRLVTTRSLLCFWAVRELNFSMASLARKFGISIVAVSKSVRRGAEIVKTEGYKLISFRASTSPF